MRLADLKTDQDAANEGVWSTYADDFELKIRSLHSDAYAKRRSEIRKPHARELDRARPDPKVLESVTLECMAGAAVADIRGLEDDDGSPIPYSKERMLELFEQIVGLADFIGQVAADPATFRLTPNEDDAGN